MNRYRYVRKRPSNLILGTAKVDFKREVEEVDSPEPIPMLADVTNGRYVGTLLAFAGRPTEGRIEPNSGHVLPHSASVTGANGFSYDQNTGQIVIYEITGPVTLTAYCPREYAISTDVRNGYSEGERKIAEEGTAVIEIYPNIGCVLPPEVRVWNAEFSYDSATGRIVLSDPIGNVRIQADCRRVYAINVSVFGGTYSGDSEIAQNGTASITITPNEERLYPSSVSISGASYDYDSSTGDIYLYDPWKAVSIDAYCPEMGIPSNAIRTNDGTPILLADGAYLTYNTGE